MEKIKLLVDMDGTLNEFRKIDTLETLYEKGYFFGLEPNWNVINAIKKVVAEESEKIEVYILSSVLSDSKYALQEKNAWLDKYLPEIPAERRIFPPCGEDKKKYVPGGVSEKDFLLDDYTNVLRMWNPPGKGIKLMNGINGTKGTWQGDKLSINKSAEELKNNIMDIVHDRKHYYDEGPLQMDDKWELYDVTLTHDGYAMFDLLVHDKSRGSQGSYKVSGLYRIDDDKNGAPLSVVSIDTYGLTHPILGQEYLEIENTVNKEVFKAQVCEGVEDILDRAKQEISRSKSVWGCWSGRVVNNETSHEYLEVDLEGISRTGELRLNIETVKENKVCDSHFVVVTVDPTNANEVESAIYDLFLKSKEFLGKTTEEFKVSQKGFSLYEKEGLQQHYEKLEKLGYEIFPEKNDYYEKLKAQQETVATTNKRKGR
ncbi:MAG: hypothetical protein IJ958_01125 [Agathobacter sp.]|nr:hypothetical protein [Agathobacter sp.]